MPKSSKQVIGKSVDMKLSNTTIIQIGVFVVGVAIVIGVGIYFTSYKPGITISPQLPANFQKTINNFIAESLKEEFSPAELIFIELNRPVPTDITYTANWTIRNIPLTVSYNSNSKIEFLTIAASVPEISVPLTEKKSSALANKIFKDFQEDWKCTTIANYSFCESFWIENGDKRSVFVFTSFGIARPKTLVVSCLIPSDSEFYDRNSCLVGEQP